MVKLSRCAFENLLEISSKKSFCYSVAIGPIKVRSSWGFAPLQQIVDAVLSRFAEVGSGSFGIEPEATRPPVPLIIWKQNPQTRMNTHKAFKAHKPDNSNYLATGLRPSHAREEGFHSVGTLDIPLT